MCHASFINGGDMGKRMQKVGEFKLKWGTDTDRDNT